jgi:hypothetical protein
MVINESNKELIITNYSFRASLERSSPRLTEGMRVCHKLEK